MLTCRSTLAPKVENVDLLGNIAASYTKGMESAAMKKILGILMVSMLGACSGSADPAPDRSADRGGLDGGGQIGLGLSWEKGVFVQPVFEEGELRLLVSNRRARAVTLNVYETAAAGDDGGETPIDDLGVSSEETVTRGARIAELAVPAQSTKTFDGAALLGPEGELLWVDADDDELGLLERPQPPLAAAALPVVSGERERSGQIETDFTLLPGPTFDATVTLTAPGHFWVEPPAYQSMHVELLTATAASSDDAAVTPTGTGFHVAIPEGTSAESPVRVKLSFELPHGVLSADTMLALDGGFLCTSLRPGADDSAAQPEDCANGAGLVRLVPAP